MSGRIGIADFVRIVTRPVGAEVTEREVDYFRDHPDELDEVSAPVSIHIAFLVYGGVLGIILVGVSKLMKFSSALEFLGDGGLEFAFDIVFEIGVALIGAAVTAYILGILLNQQQRNVTAWRSEVRRRIDGSGDGSRDEDDGGARTPPSA